MIEAFNLWQIAVLGVLSIHAAYAQDRFESIVITLTPGQTELALNISEVVKTEISLVTIVQVSTATVREIVRVTETLSGTCAAALSSAEGPLAVPVGDASGPAVIPRSTVSVVSSVPSASGSRPCDCQCLCPVSSFPMLKVTTASPVSAILTFQTLVSFVTPGQSVPRLAPSEPFLLAPNPTALDAISSTLSSENPPLSFKSTPSSVSSGNLPFDIKTFSLLDEVIVPISI